MIREAQSGGDQSSCRSVSLCLSLSVYTFTRPQRFHRLVTPLLLFSFPPCNVPAGRPFPTCFSRAPSFPSDFITVSFPQLRDTHRLRAPQPQRCRRQRRRRVRARLHAPQVLPLPRRASLGWLDQSLSAPRRCSARWWRAQQPASAACPSSQAWPADAL